MALALKELFKAITDYGFNLSGTRQIAKHRHSRMQLRYIFSSVITTKIYLSIISGLMLLVLTYTIPAFHEGKVIYLLTIPLLIGQALYPEWFFRGLEKMKYILFLDISVKSIFAIGVFLFIKKPEDYWIYPTLYAIGYIVIAVVSYIIIDRQYNVKLQMVPINKVFKTLTAGFPLFINQFFPNFYNSGTNISVGIILGTEAAGLFGAIRRVVSLLSVFNSVCTTVVFPFLNRNKKYFKEFSKLYVIIITVVSIIMVALYPLVFKLFNLNSSDSRAIYIILITGVWFVSLYSTYGTNYLIVHGMYKTVMRITIFSSLIGGILVVPMVMSFGLNGGAVNIALAQAIMAFLCLFKYGQTKRTRS